MDYRIGLNLIEESLDNELESKLWDKWLTLYPNMTEEEFISFDEFKDMHKPKKKINKKKIDKNVNKINEAYKKAVRK